MRRSRRPAFEPTREVRQNVDCFVVITEDEIDPTSIIDTGRLRGAILPSVPRLLAVEGEWGRFYVRFGENSNDEFDEDEWATITRIYANPHLTYVCYRGVRSADVAMDVLRLPDSALIDNDAGSLFTVAEVRKRISEGVAWLDRE